MIANTKSREKQGSFGDRILFINNYTPNITQEIRELVTEAVKGFLEGKYSVPSWTVGEIVFLDIVKLLVDCTPNERGEESNFDC
ncbi:hypothetical protein N8553_02130 [bacterium]|nr:hypothetical protein [bacterium]